MLPVLLQSFQLFCLRFSNNNTTVSSLLRFIFIHCPYRFQGLMEYLYCTAGRLLCNKNIRCDSLLFEHLKTWEFSCHLIIDGRHAFGVVASIVAKALPSAPDAVCTTSIFFMAPDTYNLLSSPIADTSLSRELKAHFQKQNYKTIQEVLQHKTSILMSQPGFNYHMLQDFLQFLKQNSIAHLLKE